MDSHLTSTTDDKSVVILQSLICLLREKNILSRADVEELCERVKVRAEDRAHDPLPCCDDGATEAVSIITSLSDYIGRRYGGKHRRA